ncbi:MAG TPA: type II toxin-antitoxin system VapC family toxin [Stellaceae bacterium]|nr:type II toxin-antitoxin system VapC family toxin [Stellaceae bacterium]
MTADTNVLVRAAVGDDPVQAAIAGDTLVRAELVAVPLSALCEFVWVLRRGYGRNADEIAAAIRALADSANVRLDQPAVEAGLAMLRAGGDFADGVIAFEGRRFGGTVFASFDRSAVNLVAASGNQARLLSE